MALAAGDCRMVYEIKEANKPVLFDPEERPIQLRGFLSNSK